jgi:hypothetical protein
MKNLYGKRMNLRALDPSDIDVLRYIHNEYYKDQFPFPDFFNRFLCAFAVTEDDQIVVAGGVLPIAESIILTDKNFSAKIRRNALKQVLDISKYIASQSGFARLHAFTHDETWKQHLLKRGGFEPCKGEIVAVETNGK